VTKHLIKATVLIAILFIFSAPSVFAAENQFQVSLIRAAPGNLEQLIEQSKNLKQAEKGELIIMRHSQGDHWDLMLLSPYSGKFRKSSMFGELADFHHSFIAKSKWSWNQVKKRSSGTGLFHIEMFQAQHGKYAQLLKQRQMENEYYFATQREGNIIFETVFGSDTDVFTVGFYPNLKAFATDPDLSTEVFEKAAKDAGFKARADIGFYLRLFLVGHQDTLASQVK